MAYSTCTDHAIGHLPLEVARTTTKSSSPHGVLRKYHFHRAD